MQITHQALRISGCIAGAALLSTSAAAADLSYKAPSFLSPIAAYSWTGAYIGAHVGFGQGRTVVSDPTAPGSAGITIKGFLGGGQLGFNQQVGGWVFGVEADLSGADIDGSITVSDGVGVSTSTSRVRWTSLLTGRVGYAVGPWLPYVRGGAAFGGTRFSAIEFTTGDTVDARIGRSGWTVGGGLEYALAGPWTARVQYDYVDFGSKTVALVDSSGAAFDARFKQHIHQIKFGLNHRFGW